MTSVYYSNLDENQKSLLHWIPGQYNYNDFRSHVVAALSSYYGSAFTDLSGSRSIKILPDQHANRLKADVIPCVNYKRYQNLTVIAEGVTFWNQRTGEQVINYPKLHRRNGETKNQQGNTYEMYKPCICMFKNARDRIVRDPPFLAEKYPSYFVESLFYNVPNNCYWSSLQTTFELSLSHLLGCFQDGSAARFVTQSEQHWLFGSTSVQWSQESAADLVTRLYRLWNNFS